MSRPVSERVLALAGLAQSLQQVRRIADTGQSEAAVVQTAIESLFQVDATSTADVYGGIAGLSSGLRLVRGYLGDGNKDEALARLGLSVLQLERRFVREADTASAVHNGIVEISEQARVSGSTHPEVLTALGTLYAETISHLRPRVMVQGNPHYLAQPAVVAEIRAILLAAVRSAVLWRQLGGNYWDFLFSRRAMLDAANDLLR